MHCSIHNFPIADWFRTDSTAPLHIYGAGVFAAEIADWLTSSGIRFEGYVVDNHVLHEPATAHHSTQPLDPLTSRASAPRIVGGFCTPTPNATSAHVTIRTGIPQSNIHYRFWSSFSPTATLASRLQPLRQRLADQNSKDTLDALLFAKHAYLRAHRHLSEEAILYATL